MVAGGGASVIYADTVWLSLFGTRTLLNGSVTIIIFNIFYLSINFLGSDHYCLIQVGDLGYASELGNYAEYSGAPKEEEVLQYARVVIDVRTYQLLFSVFVSLLCQMKIQTLVWYFTGLICPHKIT